MTAATTQQRSPTRLNQIIAVRQGIKNDAEKQLTEYHRLLGRKELLSGMTRVYEPLDSEGYVYPTEVQQVQVKAEVVLKEVARELTKLFDVTAAMDWTNQQARADVVLLGSDEVVTLLKDVPVTYLMFLEKQLTNLETLVRKLPILSATEDWFLDPATDIYKTPPSTTVKTKKVRRSHVLAPATDKHPAQVEPYTEDVPEGTWNLVKFSGALPMRRVTKMLSRVTTLMEAVKFAREQANLVEVVHPNPGRKVFEYLFGADE